MIDKFLCLLEECHYYECSIMHMESELFFGKVYVFLISQGYVPCKFLSFPCISLLCTYRFI